MKRINDLQLYIAVMGFLMISLCTEGCLRHLTESPHANGILTRAHDASEAMYYKIITGAKDYATYDPEYNRVASKLDSLLAYDQTRPASKALVAQDLLLIKGWAIRIGFHKGRGTLTSREAPLEHKYAEGYFNPRIRAERAAK